MDLLANGKAVPRGICTRLLYLGRENNETRSLRLFFREDITDLDGCIHDEPGICRKAISTAVSIRQ